MPHDAGEVSPADVEALFGHLRAQIRAGSLAEPGAEGLGAESVQRPLAEPGAEGLGAESVQRPLAARQEAERFWAITAEHVVVRGPGLKGAIAYPIKRLLRPFLRWYVEPALVEQRQFNAAVLRLIDELAERGDAAERPTRDGDRG